MDCDFTLSSCFRNINATLARLIEDKDKIVYSAHTHKHKHKQKEKMGENISLISKSLVHTLYHISRLNLTNAQKKYAKLTLKKFEELEKFFHENRSELCVDIGNCHFNLQDYPTAMKWYDIATLADPENKNAWNNKGVVLAKLEKFDAAIKFYDLALKLDAHDEYSLFNKGKALYKLNRLKESLHCFDLITKINPKNMCAWNNKGVILQLLGKYTDAMKCYNKALKTKPEYSLPWHNKGTIFVMQDNLEDAVKCFKKALKLNPKFQPSIEGIKKCYPKKI